MNKWKLAIHKHFREDLTIQENVVDIVMTFVMVWVPAFACGYLIAKGF